MNRIRIIVPAFAALVWTACSSPTGVDDLGAGADLSAGVDLQAPPDLGISDLAVDLAPNPDLTPADVDGGGGDVDGGGPMLLPLTPARIELGDSFACGKHASGTIRCWGNGATGNLGDGTSASRTSPGALVSGISDAVSVGASGASAGADGGRSACAVLRDGTIRCWGNNSNGQLGDGNINISRPTPGFVFGIGDALSVTVGELHACALRRGGKVSCWGYNSNYNTGIGTNNQHQELPVQALVANVVTELAIGIGHVCATDDAQTLWCWGYNFYGQTTGVVNPIKTPERILPDLLTLVDEVVAGKWFTCIRRAGNEVKCWGNNTNGVLGNGQSGTAVRITTDPQDVLGLTDVVQLAAGMDHMCARASDGTVKCWGDNSAGQLGSGSRVGQVTPMAVPGVTGAVDLMAGYTNTCVRYADDHFECWGDDRAGQLGIGTELIQTTPVTPAINSVKQIDVSPGLDGHSCAVRTDGTVACWGNGLVGQLGAGDRRDVATPQTVPGLAAVDEIGVGSDHTCARIGGAVKCWGEQRWGALGDGVSPLPAASVPVTAPVDVGGINDAVQLAVGNRFTCVRRATGTASCWGQDNSGQLGDGGTAVSRAAPAAVAVLTNVSWISAGNDHACAVQAGKVFCWGANGSNGRLGLGTDSANKLSPTEVPGLSNVVAVSCGTEHTCALRDDKRVVCWGKNDLGQIGDSTLINRRAATLLPAPTDVESIWVGGNTSCARTTTGEISCWGGNANGTLPDGTTVSRKTPEKVLGTLDVREVAISQQHGCARLVDGNVRCWGHVQNGALGTGGRQNRLGPVSVTF